MADDDVQLTDLEVIQQFSLAVRGASAPRAQVIAALESDLAYLKRPAKGPGTPAKTAAKVSAKTPAKPLAKAPAKALTKAPAKALTKAPAKKAPAKKAPARKAPAKKAARRA